MKKLASVFKVLLVALVISSLFVTSAFAAGLKGEELSLGSEDSGYKIIVPNFIGIKTVDVDGFDVTVVVMETPEKDSNGNYPIFEIVTTDEDAYYVDSFPGIYYDGQVGNFSGEFDNGRLVYSPNLAIGKDLKDISKDTIFTFDFEVYDKDYNYLISFYGLNFMFENKSESTTPAEETVVKANPTSSKIVVNGKEVAFEAYEIGGNNYFKLRDLAMALNGTEKQFEVIWDNETKSINLTKGQAYTPVGKELEVSQNPSVKEAKPTQSKIYIDGEEVQFTAYTIGGNNYFKLRDIGKVMDFGVTWNGKLKTVGIDTSVGYEE